jgi:hypothetical protein
LIIYTIHNARATNAKEVGVGNPAEETFCHPDAQFNAKGSAAVKLRVDNSLDTGSQESIISDDVSLPMEPLQFQKASV